MKKSTLFLLMFATVGLFSCSISNSSSENVKTLVTVPELGEDSRSPFSLKVLEELNNGNLFEVKARVDARAPHSIAQKSLENAVLKLSSIVDGREAQSVAATVLEYQAEEGREESVLFPIDVPLEVASSRGGFYQLELLWGQDVSDADLEQATLLKEKSTKADLVESRVEKRFTCDSDPCELTHTLYAKILNSGESKLKTVAIGVSYVWLSKGESFDPSFYIPQNESSLVVSDLSLLPGDNEIVVLELEKKIPERDDGEFVPVARILEFN